MQPWICVPDGHASLKGTKIRVCVAPLQAADHCVTEVRRVPPYAIESIPFQGKKGLGSGLSPTRRAEMLRFRSEPGAIATGRFNPDPKPIVALRSPKRDQGSGHVRGTLSGKASLAAMRCGIAVE